MGLEVVTELPVEEGWGGNRWGGRKGWSEGGDGVEVEMRGGGRGGVEEGMGWRLRWGGRKGWSGGGDGVEVEMGGGEEGVEWRRGWGRG